MQFDLRSKIEEIDANIKKLLAIAGQPQERLVGYDWIRTQLGWEGSTDRQVYERLYHQGIRQRSKRLFSSKEIKDQYGL